MKNKFLFLLMAVPGLLFAQSKNTYRITGHLVGVDDVSMVYLTYMSGYNPMVDSAKVVDHTYTLNGTIDVGQKAMLMNHNYRVKGAFMIKGFAIANLFLAPGKTEITHNGSFKDISITSAANDTYNKLATAAKIYEDKLSALKNQATSALKDRDTVKASDLYTQIYAMSSDYQEKVYADFIKKNPASPVAFYALTAYGGNEHKIDGQKLKPYFDMLPANIKTSSEGIAYKNRIDAAITFDTKGGIGSKAEDFALLDTAGNAVKLSSFKGKYVLLDFWASWCSPCRADNPHLVAAYKQYHGKGFDILSVSLDVRARKLAWLKAIDHDGLTAWTHVADLDKDQNTAAVAYGVTGIPQNFLIGPDGKIIARSLRGGDLEKQLATLLK